jgi:hypothetical protein
MAITFGSLEIIPPPTPAIGPTKSLAKTFLSASSLTWTLAYPAPFPFLPDLFNVPFSKPPLQFPRPPTQLRFGLCFLFPDEFGYDSIDCAQSTAPFRVDPKYTIQAIDRVTGRLAGNPKSARTRTIVKSTQQASMWEY